jgi:hypothetical protein
MIDSRRIRWAGYVARMVTLIAYRLLVVKQEGKRPLGRPRRGWVVNIKMDGVVQTGLIWFRIGTSGELLWMRY